MWYNQGFLKIFLNIAGFSNTSGKTVFTAWKACKDIRQILQNNHGIAWPKTFQSFRSAEEKNKITFGGKRVFRYFLNSYTTVDLTSALA